MAWTFAVKSGSGEVHESKGSNIIPGFTEGTALAAWGINNNWVAAKPEHGIATGQDLVIPFAVCRELRDIMRTIKGGPRPAA